MQNERASGRGLWTGGRVLALAGLVAACAARAPSPEALASPAWRFVRERYDRDGDGRVSRAEYTRSAAGFERLDADRDGEVTALDFEAEWDGVPRVADFTWGEGGPQVGEPAPPFELPATGGTAVALASFRGQKPVVLVFGSFT